MKSKIAERHIACDERERVGDLGKMRFLMGPNVNHYTVPTGGSIWRIIQGTRKIPRIFGGIENKPQNVRFKARALGYQH